jgi:2-keto-3-deoxy-L-rhamnonate aldolase RhmA
MKSLKSMLSENRVLVGMTTQHVTTPWLARLWQRSGTDFVYIEYEHSFMNEAELAGFVLCCRSHGLPVVAKTPELSRTHIAKLLEAGVIGIQLPWTESRSQVDELVDYDSQMSGRELIEAGNRETVILAHIETRRGIENIDSILGHPQVDVMFLGMYDLSISYGQPGSFSHPDVVAAVELALAAARRHGKVAGMYVPDAHAAAPWIARGMRFFETASEVDLIDAGARRVVAEFRQAASSTASK